MADLVAKIVPGKGKFYSSCINDFNCDIESGICSVALNEKGLGDRSKVCSYC